MKSLGLLLFIALLVGCSNGFNARLDSVPSVVPGALDTVPETDKIDPQCATSASYEACIFNKNPVYHSGRVFENVVRSEIESSQTLGVKILGLDTSGFLENSDFKIMTARSPRVDTTNRSHLKVMSGKATGTEVEQVMTYYYFHLALKHWSERGTVAVKGKGVKVVVDDGMTGFRQDNNTIYLSRSGPQWGPGLDASQSLYLLGTANAHYASDGNLLRPAVGDTTHVRCGADPKGCCKTAEGCSRALVSAVSLYFVAVIFPSAPALGELTAERLGGFRLCQTVDRDLRTLASLNRASAYAACSARPGDVHILGGAYAAALWEFRKKLPGSDRIELDRIYLEHLSQLRSTDTLVTARGKLLVVASVHSATMANQLAQALASRGF